MLFRAVPPQWKLPSTQPKISPAPHFLSPAQSLAWHPAHARQEPSQNLTDPFPGQMVGVEEREREREREREFSEDGDGGWGRRWTTNRQRWARPRRVCVVLVGEGVVLVVGECVVLVVGEGVVLVVGEGVVLVVGEGVVHRGGKGQCCRCAGRQRNRRCWWWWGSR